MKKTLLLAAILALTTSTVIAADTTTPIQDKSAKNKFERPMGPPPGAMKDREARKAEFEKRLNLTEEQKAKIKKNREADKVKMDPGRPRLITPKAKCRMVNELIK